MANKRYIKRAYSKSPLRTYTYNVNEATVFPDFSFQAVLNMVDDDTTARGAITHFVDKCMEGQYNLIKKKTLKYDREFEFELNEKYMFRTNILRKEFLVGKLFNNAFVEIVRNTDKTPKGLNILDSMNVDPITEPNGDPIKYKSKTPSQKTGKYAYWNKEDIVWIKFGDRNGGFAPVDLKALWENLCAKSYIRRYVAWLWKTGQYRLIYNFKSASDKNIGDFLAYARKHDNNFKAPFITKGEMETKLLRDMRETESLVKLFEYYDGQTLILLRIPPIDAGIPDASGRSSSDAQNNNLSTHITSMKTVIEDKTNFELFPKMGHKENMLRFAPNDRFAVKQVFENIQIMQSMGMTNEVIQEYLADCGIFYKSTLFKPPEEVSPTENPRNLDSMPSRKGKGTGEANKKIGTGTQGTTRENQLKK